MNDCLDDFVWLNVIAAAESSHDRQMHLRCGADASAQFLNGISAILCPEELTIMLHLIADNRGGRQPHFIHPDRVQVSPELLTVELHIDQPVVIILGEGTGIINEKISRRAILTEFLLCSKGVAAGEDQQLHAVQRNIIQLILKFPIFIIPEDDSALIELRQGCSKPSSQVLFYFVGIHPLPSFPVFLFWHFRSDIKAIVLSLIVFLFQFICEICITHAVHIRHAVPNQGVYLGMIEEIQSRIQ